MSTKAFCFVLYEICGTPLGCVNVGYSLPHVKTWGYSKRDIKDKYRAKFWRDAVPGVLISRKPDDPRAIICGTIGRRGRRPSSDILVIQGK